MKTTPLPSVIDESEPCQWENCGGGRYCEKHSLESKDVSLSSVEEVVEKVYWEDQWDGSADEVQELLTQDRNQAYTRLVEGIEGMKKYPVIGSSDQQIADSLWRNDTLTDILENVVKPLYGKK